MYIYIYMAGTSGYHVRNIMQVVKTKLLYHLSPKFTVVRQLNLIIVKGYLLNKLFQVIFYD